MEQNNWDCCRLCLGVENLYPIYYEPEHHDKYTNVLFTVTGVKVEQNDNLPQHLCSTCIHFINNCIRFRKQCEENNMQLLSRLNGKQFYSIKIEATPLLKTEANNPVKIDISHFLIDVEDDFGDYEDNITLNSLKYNSISKPDDALDCTQTNETIKEPLNDEKDTTDNTKVKRKTRVQKIKANSEKKTKKHGETDKKEVRCEYCNKSLTSKLSLRNHYKIHTGFDVVCEHCGKKFITRRLLLMHCRAKHGYEKTDKCSYCDYRASNAEQVKIHERLHTGERPYACSQCDAAFHRKSSYLQHIAIHLPEKTVQCDQCPARFKSVTLMRIHRSRHRAAAYRFQCRVCEGSFARRRNVVRHLLRVHNLPPEQQHIDRRKIG